MSRPDSNQPAEDAPQPDGPAPEAKDAAPGEPGPHGKKHHHGPSQKEAEAHDKYLRAMADLENFKKRAIREKEELRLYAATRILEDLVPVIDNLALGLAAAKQPNADMKTLVGGVDMVFQQLKGALSAHGLKEISPVGQKFDPHQHEALSHEASAGVPAEHVISVVRSGYLLNGRLLRPAAVIVSNGPGPS